VWPLINLSRTGSDVLAFNYVILCRHVLCHILGHEDLGMMNIIRVQRAAANKAADADVSSPSPALATSPKQPPVKIAVRPGGGDHD
jgi:hypothetical protein